MKAGTILKNVARRVSIPVFNAFFARIRPRDCIRAPKKEKRTPLKRIFSILFLKRAQNIPEIIKIIPMKSIKEIFSFKNIKESKRVIKGEEVKISMENWGPKRRKLSNRSQSPMPKPIAPLKDRYIRLEFEKEKSFFKIKIVIKRKRPPKNNLETFTFAVPKYLEAFVKKIAVKDQRKDARRAKISPFIIPPLLPFPFYAVQLSFPEVVLELLHKRQIP